MTPSHVLRAAADRIERDGWCQREPAIASRRCAARAIVEAAGPSGIGVCAAMTAVLDHLGRRAASGIVHWNDAPGRTVDEVLAALRGAAQEADRGR